MLFALHCNHGGRNADLVTTRTLPLHHTRLPKIQKKKHSLNPSEPTILIIFCPAYSRDRLSVNLTILSLPCKSNHCKDYVINSAHAKCQPFSFKTVAVVWCLSREVATNPKLGGLRGYPPKSGGATGKIVGLTAKKVGGLKPPQPPCCYLPAPVRNQSITGY